MNRINVTRSSMPPYEEFAEAIKPLWESHWITNMGKYHKELEAELRDYLAVPELSLMVNGHMALEMTIQAFGFPEGSEVITTPFTFISTTHSIVRNHLIPVFCDIRPEDGTLDPDKLEDLITERTVAILPVHVYGNVCDVEVIQSIAEKYNLKVIYDAAHAFGVTYGGEGIGCFGDASIFSFHATKVYNTIEGGAVTFRDRWLYDKLYNLKNFGIHGEELVTDVGANAKMNEFAAIMGLLNLKHLSEALADRCRVYELYRRELVDVPGIRFLKTDSSQEGCKFSNNFAYFPILVEGSFPIDRDALHQRLLEQDIHSRKYFYPLTSDQACFKNKFRKLNLPVARDMAKRVLSLPIYEGLEEETQYKIMDIIRKA